MRRLSACLLAAVLAAPGLAAQQAATDSIAAAGARGVYVWLGGTVVSRSHPSGGVVAHRVERRPAGGGNWQPVGDVSAVADAGALFGPLYSATRSAVRQALRGTTDDAAWNFIVRHPTADSLSLLLGHETVRLALGLYALDRNVRPGERWQYRVSNLDGAGNASSPVVSNVVSYPAPALPDSVRTLRVDQGRRGRSSGGRCRLSPRFAGSDLAPRRHHGRVHPARLVAAFQRVADSVQASYRDTTLVAVRLYQYYAPAPRGFFFNAGPASDTITAYSVNAVRLAAPDSIAARGSILRASCVHRASRLLGLARKLPHLPVSRLGAAGGIRWSRSPASCGTSWTTRVIPMRTYYYRITTLGLKDDESPATAAAFAHVASRIPPQPPMNVRVDTARGGLRVQWTANGERDLQGYYVFPHRPPGG